MTGTRQYRYVITDVFSRHRFGGNPLAVMLDAEGLDSATMQRIAREFNFSESTFVLPPERGGSHRVRIFTPTREVPFAGHPNIGTAAVLASGIESTPHTFEFEELAGNVPVVSERRDEGIWCELRAPEPLTVGAQWPAVRLAEVLSLDEQDIVTSHHVPCEASVGLEFLMVELDGASALARATINPMALDALAHDGGCADIHCYVRDGQTIDARMFAPLDGVPEDPATGSANCALVALLASLPDAPHGELHWEISQGVIMGRPSALSARTNRIGDRVTGVWIAGFSVPFAEGVLEV